MIRNYFVTMNYTLGSIILILVFIVIWTNEPPAEEKAAGQQSTESATAAPVPAPAPIQKFRSEIWYATREISFIAEKGIIYIPAGSEVEKVGPNTARYQGRPLPVGPGDLSPTRPADVK
jgi:hypothetical protein